MGEVNGRSNTLRNSHIVYARKSLLDLRGLYKVLIYYLPKSPGVCWN